MKKWLTSFVLIATLASVSVPTANAHLASGKVFDACMKLKTPTANTTSKGSKEVRKELNKLNQTVECRYSELFKEVNRQGVVERSRHDRADAVFRRCLKSKGFTVARWEKKYSIFSNRAPCLKEASDRRYEWNLLSSVSIVEMDMQQAWLEAIQLLTNLAGVYPNSVKPEFLAQYIENGKRATACLSTKKWCYQE